MTFHKLLTDHLSDYRERELGVKECGVFVHRGKALPKGHILPVELKWLNILPGARDQARNYLAAHPGIHLHRYFHHLNSSQAFALNLFVPYFEGGPEAAGSLIRALELEGPLVRWALEEIPDAEEETNIDVTWCLSGERSFICEVKLSEADFGTADQDEKHLAKLAKTYAPVLRDNVEAELLEPEAFCSHYQILRMAWHAVRAPTPTLLFLMPRANGSLWQALPKVVARFSETLRDRVRILAVEDVLATLRQDRGAPSDLQAHAAALCLKYLPQQPGLTRNGSVPRA